MILQRRCSLLVFRHILVSPFPGEQPRSCILCHFIFFFFSSKLFSALSLHWGGGAFPPDYYQLRLLSHLLPYLEQRDLTTI